MKELSVLILKPKAFSIVTDLICTALPIFVLWKVQISTKKKLAIWALMSVGLMFVYLAYLVELVADSRSVITEPQPVVSFGRYYLASS